MMTLDAAEYEPQARKAVKWITTQRNGQGGFYSTQVRGEGGTKHEGKRGRVLG